MRCHRRMLTIGGETLCLSEWARRKGVRVNLVHDRIRNGWPPRLAVTTPGPASDDPRSPLEERLALALFDVRTRLAAMRGAA